MHEITTKFLSHGPEHLNLHNNYNAYAFKSLGIGMIIYISWFTKSYNSKYDLKVCDDGTDRATAACW
jgi:hypothetical protein